MLAARGATVVLTDIRRDAAERVAGEIAAAGGRASAPQQDTAKPDNHERVVVQVVQAHGALHLAVNNAGIGGAAAPAGAVDLADWRRVIDINLNGVLYGLRYQIPAMLEAGAARSAMVNMASIHGMVAALGNGAYTAAKHGVVGLTRNAAAEYGPRGLRINAVGPGYIETPLLENLPADVRSALAAKHPLGRLGSRRTWRRWWPSYSRTRRPSSPAATIWWTVATRRCECTGAATARTSGNRRADAVLMLLPTGDRMRSSTLTCVAALTLACAPAGEQAAAPSPLDAVAGSWTVTALQANNDSVLVSYELTATATTDGWTTTLPDRAPEPVRVVLVDGDSVVAETGPFESVLRPGVMVSTRSVVRVRGDSLAGTMTATYAGAGADSVMVARLRGARKMP